MHVWMTALSPLRDLLRLLLFLGIPTWRRNILNKCWFNPGRENAMLKQTVLEI